MSKVGICGNFGKGKEIFDGQTIKTKILYEELVHHLGSANISKIDTYNWRGNPLKLLFNCLVLLITTKKIIMLPARNGVRLIIPIFGLLNHIFQRELYFSVIGGWLMEVLNQNKGLIKVLKRFDNIFVETKILQNDLMKLGLDNVSLIPNFKRLDIINGNDLNNKITTPFPVCTFSRVIQKKGIEDAIRTVTKINNENNSIIYTLDIYGEIDNDYSERFEKVMQSAPAFIRYKGVIPYDQSVEVLKEYFLLLFPTQYYKEGIPGTIVDAYAAGIPVISSAWQSAHDIIEDDITGWVYNFNDLNEFEVKLLYAANNPGKVFNMKNNCIDKAREYHPDVVMKKYLELIN